MLAECRIRLLKIHSQEAVAVPRITSLLEDAIRTASLPNIPVNGVLCIRRLDLGRITTSTNSRFLTRRLDQLVGNLTSAQITVETPDQDDATVVWFADDIEPYRCFAELLAKGCPPRAWYWPAVVPGWSQSMSEPEGFLVCVSQLVQKATGITGLSYALEPLVRTGAMLTVMQKVRPRELGAIINSLPLSAVPNTKTGFAGRNTSVANVSASSTTTVRLPNVWQTFMQQALQCWRPDDGRLRLAFNMALNIAGLQRNANNSKALVQSILRLDSPAAMPGETSQSTPVQAGADKTVRPVSGKPGEDKAISAASLAARTAPLPERLPFVGSYVGEVSAHGGFLLLIPVMYRLGMTSLMESETGEVDPQLPERVLWRIARWLGIPADDPVLQFMERPIRSKLDTVPFLAPGQWQAILKKGQDTKLDLIRVRQQPTTTLIKDPLSRLVLGALQANHGEQVPAWLDRYPRQSSAGMVETWTLDNLVDNLAIAMCRYVRQYSQMNMRTLVKRRAYIAVTRTHVDWSASLSALDNRVRMAGLDIDPGWVSWLQRVFYFHYIDEEA